MNAKNSLLDGEIAKVGRDVVAHLKSAREILLPLAAGDESMRGELSACAQDILVLAVRVAGLCCGGDSTREMVEFLSACGVSISAEFVMRRRRMEELLDCVPGVMPE